VKRSLVVTSVLGAFISLNLSRPAMAESVASSAACGSEHSPQIMLSLHRGDQAPASPTNSSAVTTVDSPAVTPTANPGGSVDAAQVSGANPADLDPNALHTTPGATAAPTNSGASGQSSGSPGAGGVPNWQTSETPFAPEGTKRRCLPSPLDPVFCGTEWVGQPVIGLPDSNPVYKLEGAIYKACPVLKQKRIQIYGWANPGGGYSSSHRSNIPLSYAIVPRRLEMEQLVLRFERSPDTVQTEHCDWGFRVSNVFGSDYRYTTAAGWYPASKELLKHNMLYGYDLVECYGLFYVPRVAKGLSIRYGRYISPPDIEAQLSPDNYLWTHSLMFTVDAYTHTGIQTAIKLSDNLTLLNGIHAGSDMAPWFKGAQPTLESYVRWVSKTNNDSIFGGVDGINNGRFRLARETVQVQQDAQALSILTGQTVTPPHVPAHDNLQQFNITWGHRFSRRVHTMTEGYYLYSYDALMGGTTNNGPPRHYNELTGPGTFLHGRSGCLGFVNYTNFKISDHDYISLRPIDYLVDNKGWRTGFPTTYASWTAGWCHRFSDTLCIRPEIRYERSLLTRQGIPVTPYDNGHRAFQFTCGMDVIQRF
jgi:hypothetical protein